MPIERPYVRPVVPLNGAAPRMLRLAVAVVLCLLVVTGVAAAGVNLYTGTTSQKFMGRHLPFQVLVVGNHATRIAYAAYYRCGNSRYDHQYERTILKAAIPVENGRFTATQRVKAYLHAPFFHDTAKVSGTLRGTTVTGSLTESFILRDAPGSQFFCTSGKVTFSAPEGSEAPPVRPPGGRR